VENFTFTLEVNGEMTINGTGDPGYSFLDEELTLTVVEEE
jgi:hypothetical protein